MNSEFSSHLDIQNPDSFGAESLLVALIGPDEERRKAAAQVLEGCRGCEVREFASYPPSLDDVPRWLEQHFDVILIDLDSHPEYALEMVECICSQGGATVMVYSSATDPDLLVRCMRAGAREFLPVPLLHDTVAEAMIRASARRPAQRSPRRKQTGKMLVFLGAKGGSGVTTLACNFAVALAQDSSQSTVLIDLDLPLGDAALNLGINAEFSTVDALRDFGRLDGSFLSKLLSRHSSGLSVLAAPGKFSQFEVSNEAVEKLLLVARQEFDNVIVDMGSRLDLTGTALFSTTALFKDAYTIYLVTQAGIPELRNSNRLIGKFFGAGGPNLEIVINRYQPRDLGVGDEHITKALTRPARWKIPNDYVAVRQMQNTATPLVMEDSPIARLIRQMVASYTGQAPPQAKKKAFSFRNLGKSIASKKTSFEEGPPAGRPAEITTIFGAPRTDSASSIRGTLLKGADGQRDL